MDLNRAVILMTNTLVDARIDAPPFESSDEGYLAIEKAVENMHDEWRSINMLQHTGNLKKEAIQVAAQALRFLIDLC